MKFRCENCGYIYSSKFAFAKCPKCGSNAKKFLGAGK
jgi:rubrerythrin